MNHNYCMRMTDKRLRTYLPAEFCQMVGITPNSPVAITCENGKIVIEHALLAHPTSDAKRNNELALAIIRMMDANALQSMRDAMTVRAIELAKKEDAD